MTKRKEQRLQSSDELAAQKQGKARHRKREADAAVRSMNESLTRRIGKMRSDLVGLVVNKLTNYDIIQVLAMQTERPADQIARELTVNLLHDGSWWREIYNGPAQSLHEAITDRNAALRAKRAERAMTGLVSPELEDELEMEEEVENV